MIDSFKNEYRFLSNFHSVEIEQEGVVYPSSEHAYMAMKTTDENLRKEISKLKTPREAKKFGRKIILRDNWDDLKISYMEEILKKKFSNPELKEKLKATGNQELVEGNTWGDVFWGVCNGIGQNNLGKILMKIRDEIK